MKRFLAAALLVLLASPAFAQDVYVKTRAHSDAFAIADRSQPARDDVFEQWFSGGKTAQSGRDIGMIVDLDANMAYIIIHGDKSYVPLPLPMDIIKILPPEVASMAPMIQMSATVTATAETKTIGQWNCTGYDVALSVMGVQGTQRVWASTEPPAGYTKKATLSIQDLQRR